MMPADRRAARIGFLISALGGAAGLWINAASVVIAIGLTGVMAVLAAALAGRAGGGLRAQGMVCEPGLWRTWGRWGAAASVVLFLVEQCPDRLLAWRLEINHPLYALAWLGGGELVALALEYLGGARWSAGRWRRAALAAAAVCVVPMVIVIWRERVFVPLDPFVARIHQNIGEFLSLPSRIAELGWRRFLDQTVLRVLLFILAAVTLWRMRRQPVAVLVLSFALAVALPMYAMGWWQMRWMLPASVPQIVLAVAVLDLWLGGAAAAPVKRFRSALFCFVDGCGVVRADACVAGAGLVADGAAEGRSCGGGDVPALPRHCLDTAQRPAAGPHRAFVQSQRVGVDGLLRRP
ncbi:hypothetical protein Ga0100230_014430 [Opitutaceae bacterium TAV3]|nr:hypothetical protein Ga0100230_014430 [Opitutaceae bacterium TAV3]